MNLTRYHGVFAPNSKLRAQVTLSGRGKRIHGTTHTAAERHQAMSWTQRLKRVFQIDIERCECCGGKMKIIASITHSATIEKIIKPVAGQARGPPATPVTTLH